MMLYAFLAVTLTLQCTITWSLPADEALPSEIVEKNGKCTEPESLLHGVFLLEPDGQSIEYICQPGYILVGNEYATCQNGRWSSEKPVCIGTDCPQINVRHGTITTSHQGGIARVKCRRGFRLSGPSLLACIDGQWNSTEQPACLAEDTARRQYNNKIVGKSVEFGDMDKSKLTHEQWLEYSDYSCVQPDYTVLPPIVRNARYFMQWALHGGLPRLYATYQCNWGYVNAISKKTVYCRQEQWVGVTPNCQYFNKTEDDELQSDVGGTVGYLSHEELLRQADYTCVGSTPEENADPPMPEHAAMTLKFSIGDGKPRLYAMYTCQDGYGLKDSSHKYMYCKNRMWIGTMPACIDAAAAAGDGCQKNNGGCEHLCTSHFGIASCSCKQGFTLADDQRTCLDVDECDVNNGGCEQICDNAEGEFACDCYEGYQLNDDKTTCSVVGDRK